MAPDDELSKRIAYLKSALNLVEAEFGEGRAPPDGLDDLRVAVDGIRSNVWALLSAQHADDYDRFVGRFRMRRGTDICERVVSNIERGTITDQTPEIARFHDVLRGLANALHVASRVK